MTLDRWNVIIMREVEAGPCHACGSGLSQSETGFAIELVTEAVFLDPALLEPLLQRRCLRCGARYEWDILVVGEDDDLDREWPEKEAQQAGVLATLQDMLSVPRLQPREAAKLIRRRFGVEGIYVDDGSEVAWPLRRLLDG